MVCIVTMLLLTELKDICSDIQGVWTERSGVHVP